MQFESFSAFTIAHSAWHRMVKACLLRSQLLCVRGNEARPGGYNTLGYDDMAAYMQTGVSLADCDTTGVLT